VEEIIDDRGSDLSDQVGEDEAINGACGAEASFSITTS